MEMDQGVQCSLKAIHWFKGETFPLETSLEIGTLDGKSECSMNGCGGQSKECSMSMCFFGGHKKKNHKFMKI